MGAAFVGLVVDRILIFLDDPKDNIKYFENKRRGIVMLPSDVNLIKKSRTGMRDSKHLIDIYIFILSPREGAVHA
ncbi:hypothetical protein BIY40_00230 [Pediococcus acidilactici]|nr:hypothetical protein BIY40_00230 [Pediococcus acidilactici]